LFDDVWLLAIRYDYVSTATVALSDFTASQAMYFLPKLLFFEAFGLRVMARCIESVKSVSV
jgi:Gpi18-like mannosyltransferase